MNIENNKKFCSECNLYLSVEEFKKLTSPSALEKYSDGYYWCCSSCYKNKMWIYTTENEPTNRKMRRRFKLQRRLNNVEITYGLSQEDYLSKINDQKNLCAICKTKNVGKVLCVDHDHKTGKVRGLLCTNCNVGLGNLKDNIQILQSAIEYLQNYSTAESGIKNYSLEKGEITKNNS